MVACFLPGVGFMKWPFVSRLRYELLEERLKDRDDRIAELVKVNQDLVELSKMSFAKPDEEEKPEPPKPHRRLAADIRREFSDAAWARKAESDAAKGVKK